MQRRSWLYSSGVLLVAGFSSGLWIGCKSENFQDQDADIFSRLLKENDALVSRYLETQITDPDHPDRGGFYNQHQLVLIGPVGWAIHRLIASYMLPASQHYQSEQVATAIAGCADFALRKQHNDGTIDLLTTNFHSTPDVAFMVEPVALAYKMAQEKDLALGESFDKIETFLLRAGEALSVGGIHTPNHRWVVCMALARLYELFPQQKYLDRVEIWLREKIDIDADGQYTERSTGVYSPLVNRWLITIADLLDKKELYHPVRQNLDMTLFHMHPNGEVATEASRRQDQYQARNFAAYFYPYQYMAHLDQNATYGAMANWIKSNVPFRNLSTNLLYLLEHPELKEDPPLGVLPTNYVKHFPHSALVRIRRENVDASILAENSAFFTMQKGAVVLQAMRMASAFFGKGQLEAEELEIKNGAYVLTQSWEGPYYQPYPVDSLPETGSWEDMPRDNRPQSEVQKLEAIVTITEQEGQFTIDFDLTGTDHITRLFFS